jgi:hypothetical protein
MTSKNKKKKSSQTRKSGTNSSSSQTKQLPLVTKEFEVEGHKMMMKLRVLGKRSDTLVIPPGELEKIPEKDIISVSDLAPKPYPVEEPSSLADPANPDRDIAKELAVWKAKKEEWEKLNAIPDHLKDHKEVNCWVPVTKAVQATMDGMELKIFHTVRGPIMGAIQGSEDMHRAFLYSPAYIDPNIERGRIHFLPVALAGFEFTMYKSNCIGESIPQEAEVLGYPSFVERNKKGDYQFRMKSAYHHIDADLPDSAKVVSADIDVRAASEGAVVTTDTKEGKLIDKVRSAKQQAAQQAARQAAMQASQQAQATKPDQSTQPVEAEQPAE